MILSLLRRLRVVVVGLSERKQGNGGPGGGGGGGGGQGMGCWGEGTLSWCLQERVEPGLKQSSAVQSSCHFL